MQLRMESRPVGDVLIVQCSGRIIAGKEVFTLHSHVGDSFIKYGDIVLQLDEVEFIDSSGLGALVRLMQAARAKGGDFRRRRRLARLCRTGPLRRSRRRPNPACLALYAAIQPPGFHAARLALGAHLHQCMGRAHGYAPAAQSQLRHLLVPASIPSDPRGAEAIWDDHGRQRQLHVRERRPGQSLEQRRSRKPEAGPGFGVRSHPDGPHLHPSQCSPRQSARDRELYRNSAHQPRRTTGSSELERDGSLLFRRLPTSWRSARQHGDRLSHRDHHLYAGRDQPIQPFKEESYGHDPITAASVFIGS